jgi:hypothetical protein
MDSNLSKIKPKLRTEGRVSGNFGKNKVRAGSILSEIGMTDAPVLKITTKDEYLNRMVTAYETTEDPKLKKFCYEEVRKIMVQRGVW